MCQDEIIEFLSDPGSYGLKDESVERRQTHGAIVFLAGDRAYKLKRAVRFPYMDYSTVALRRRMCEAELTINRAIAPEIYLEVRAIVRDVSGALSFSPPSDDAIDWVVVMRRFNEDQLLEQMRKRGALDVALMRALAETIAHFHSQADVRRDKGGRAGIAAVADENVQIFQGMAGRLIDRKDVDTLCARTRETLERLGDVLEARRTQGFVRRCHGDLHLNNICVVEGRPLLFDAIEFSEDFACIDVIYDLAFLLMDIDRHGLRPLANALLNGYMQTVRDYGGLEALPLFLSCRATIRSHVAATRGERGEARDLFGRAIEYLSPSPPRLVAVGGVSGTGKSTLAQALAPVLGAAPGAIVLRSDVIRKTLLGAKEFERLPESAYGPDVTRLVYAELVESARRVLITGHSAIADAVFGREEERARLAEMAARLAVRFDGLWLRGESATLEQRIAHRKTDASDATVDVLQQQLAYVSPPSDWNMVRADAAPEQARDQSLQLLGLEPTNRGA